jgi:molecular chaperone GrpE
MSDDKTMVETESEDGAQATVKTVQPAPEATPTPGAAEGAERAGTAGPPATGPTAVEPLEIKLPAEELEALRGKAAKADEYYSRLLRAVADLDNFRKRAAREREELGRLANELLLSKLVPVLDNLEAALAAANNCESATIESFKTGMTMISNQLKTVLAEAGLEEIDATGQPFDPKWHEAVSQQPSGEVPEGHVVQQLRKGYRYRERLLRAATVVVAARPASA